DPIQVVSFIYLLVIFNFKNYQSKIFQFFSCFTTILIIIRYSPKVASIFNGLSAPQYRWHYITYLFIAITIGIGIEQILKHKSLKSSIFASGLTLLIYYSTLKSMDNSYDINKKYFMVLIAIAMLFYVILSYTILTMVQ